MRMYKSPFSITLIAGIIILLIGIYLEAKNMYSGGYAAGRFGGLHYEKINVFSGIFIGILLLLLSIMFFGMSKAVKKRLDNIK